MLQESVDLIAEAEELHGFLQTLDPEDWQRPTGFMSWTPWDVVAHLHYFDHVSLLAMTDVDAFTAKRDALIADIMKKMTNQQIARRDFGDCLDRKRSRQARAVAC